MRSSFTNHITTREIPFSQLSSPLSPAAESGQIAREIGFGPTRTSLPPRDSSIPVWSVRYCHPPMPSASRPAPVRPRI